VLHPLLDQRDVDRICRCARFGDDAHGGIDDVRVAFVEDEQHVRVVGVVRAVGFDRVVEPEHGRCRAALHDAAHDVERVDEGTECVRGAPFRGGARVPRDGADDDPSVPSEPTKSCVRSGPLQRRRAARRDGVPSASTMSRPVTMSSIFP
jgi:hypothetical protein